MTTDTAYTDALARALNYSDDVGLSDGTDRPATTTSDVLPEIAHPERHTYGSGRAFYLVPCYRCGIILNSGHHYDEVAGIPSPFAVAIAAEHNRSTHADVLSEVPSSPLRFADGRPYWTTIYAGMAAGTAAGWEVVAHPYAWQAPTARAGHTFYELRQSVAGRFEWIKVPA